LVTFLHFFRRFAADNFSAHPDHERVAHSLQAQCLFSPFPQAFPPTIGTSRNRPHSIPSLLHITHASFSTAWGLDRQHTTCTARFTTRTQSHL